MNPLFDLDFLTQLTNYRQREIYARVTLLTRDELPIEYIEGRVTGGSINVDGNSALRRTCNITMILKDQSEMNKFYWTFKQKFILEIGLKNVINRNYPDIIWFKQGMFIITTCNTSQSVNNFTITINGKDKMCLLNGDLSGSLSQSVDFGMEEYYDKKTNTTTRTPILLKTAIREAVQSLGGELASNIIINDLDQAGLELMEYRCDTHDLYGYRNVSDGQIENMTLDATQDVILEDDTTMAISDERMVYAVASELLEGTGNPTRVKYGTHKDGTDKICNVMKFSYGDLVGYRLTDLTYAGQLIANVGETLVSVLDKIRNMLGNFEYFYNIDGKFVFQKKHTYISTPWTAVEAAAGNVINKALNDAHPFINLTNAELITSFNNNPNLLNLKNDFAVWGTRKSISGTEIPIHMRYAIDRKPTYYKSPYQQKIYTTKDWDWRELIYQMAIDYRRHSHDDDFLYQIATANPSHYPLGKTGYETYYIDLEGFWRQLYNPNPEPTYIEISADKVNALVNKDNICVENAYRPMTEDECEALKKYVNGESEEEPPFTLQDIYVRQDYQTAGKKEKWGLFPFIGSKLCCLTKSSDAENVITYYYLEEDKFKSSSDQNVLNKKSLSDLYIAKDDDKKILVINQCYLDIADKVGTTASGGVPLWVKDDENIMWADLKDTVKKVYCGGISGSESVVQYMHNWSIKDNYGTLSTTSETSEKVTYLEKMLNGDYQDNYWHIDVSANPSSLTFWFDFLDVGEGSDLEQYAVQEIGARTKFINDSNVKSIYYRDVPTTIFLNAQTDEKYDRQSGYTYIKVSPVYSGLFAASSQGKSAKDSIDELLQNHSYVTESATISAIPIYHLEPNTRIALRDDSSNINGEYIISKITIPLTYNGTMSLTGAKVVSDII